MRGWQPSAVSGILSETTEPSVKVRRWFKYGFSKRLETSNSKSVSDAYGFVFMPGSQEWIRNGWREVWDIAETFYSILPDVCTLLPNHPYEIVVDPTIEGEDGVGRGEVRLLEIAPRELNTSPLASPRWQQTWSHGDTPQGLLNGKPRTRSSIFGMDRRHSPAQMVTPLNIVNADVSPT